MVKGNSRLFETPHAIDVIFRLWIYARKEDTCAGGNRGNGCRDQVLVTTVGTINLRVYATETGSRAGHLARHPGAEAWGGVVQAFLSRKSLMRMLGAVFAEMGEDWMARRWLAEDAIALAASST